MLLQYSWCPLSLIINSYQTKKMVSFLNAIRHVIFELYMVQVNNATNLPSYLHLYICEARIMDQLKNIPGAM